MTQRINDKLKKCCELCQSNLDKPCAWLSLGNEYCDTIMEAQSDIEIKDKVIEKTCKYINESKIMNKAIPVYPNKVDTPYTVGVASIEEIKQHFYKQVEKVGGEDE